MENPQPEKTGFVLNLSITVSNALSQTRYLSDIGSLRVEKLFSIGAKDLDESLAIIKKFHELAATLGIETPLPPKGSY